MIERGFVFSIFVFALVAPVAKGQQDPPEVDEAAQARLDAPVTLHFPDPTALDVVLEEIRKEAGKNLASEVDRASLKKANMGGDVKVQVDVEGVPLKAALNMAVRQAKLIYSVRDSKATVAVDSYKEPSARDLEVRMKAVDTTIYAPGYDEAKFRSIEVGMDTGQVHKLVGKPLRETRSKPRVDWYYGPPTLRVTEDGGMFDTSGFFANAWGYTIARAGPDGKVVEFLGGYFPDVPNDLVGHDLADMKKRFGEPNAVRSVKSAHYLVYSGPKDSGSFRTRAVGLDKDGKVAEIIAGYYFD